jgi:hypothetical protein
MGGLAKEEDGRHDGQKLGVKEMDRMDGSRCQ